MWMWLGALHGIRAVEGRVGNSKAFDRLVHHVAHPSGDEWRYQRAERYAVAVDLQYRRAR